MFLSTSCMLIISPGIKKEAFNAVEKLTISLWFAAVQSFHLPYRRAWPSVIAPIATAFSVITLFCFTISCLSSTIKGSAL